MTKPLVFNYKAHEELRDAYKDLLEDNQKLMDDNRKLREKVRHQAERVNSLLMENTDLKIKADRNESMYNVACSIIDINHETIQTYTRIFKMQEAELQKLRKEVIK